ncbi:hypothetical protein MNBD_GAMMA25-1237 [hydrothermal vent metagenome]|uniref:Response regulatory domain-containing protein n=1 Tax=hydrothermal vent metagenome TaxID=652676 RepID=A0A3B1AUP0_9ZZZZ
MKYRIIWIDDSQTWVRSVKDELIEIFEEHDFAPEVEVYQRIDLARSPIDNNYVDLIIVDCNLPDNMSGDQFIRELRENRCFAHIVFYSNDSDNLKVLEEDKHFLHVTHRDNIFDTLGVVADQAHRKYRHPAFMRGLLLSEFIDLENLMEDLIVQCFKNEGEYFRASIINKGGENYSLAAKNKFISRLIRDAKGMEPSLVNKFNEIALSSNQFQEKIMGRRNILAHAHPEYDAETGKIVLTSSFPDVEFNGDWFHETRDHIHNHKNKLRKLIGLDLYNIVNP